MLAYGAFPGTDGQLLLPGGWLPAQATAVLPVETTAITESTVRARYVSAGPAHPAAGTTVPALDRIDAYSWIKAPRLWGSPCEVGPLARAVLAGRDPGGRGVMARHRARQGEASLLARAMMDWLVAIAPGVAAIAGLPAVPATGNGVGLTEGPRGALGHWLAIGDGRVAHYGIVTPATWNASPRDETGVPGPLERSLEGVTLADATDAIEVMRIVHSFDPCLQCAVH